MENTLVKPLQIISASAGSGKTYKLVLTYLELLLQSAKAEPFAHIVAMTFTNKAALEMKTRIVEALEILSFPDQFEPHQRKYEAILCEKFKCKPTELALKAKLILQRILHRYEDFRILTIDKFNLRLIRSFSRELDLPADFEVIIDEDEVLEKVVDQLLGEIGNGENETLTNLVLGYAQSQLEEGEKWNFRGDLIKFIALIKSEKQQKTIDELMKIEFSEGDFFKFKEALKKEKKAFLTYVAEFGKYLESIDFWMNLKDIAGGSTTSNQVSKYLNVTEPDAIFMTVAAVQNLSEGNKSKPPINGMAEKLLVIKPIHDQFYKSITLLNAIRKNYHNMWLLKILAGRLEQMRQDESLIRISEFNQLIGKLVQNEEAPFLYERLGNRYENYLLDEFQDTSRMQWLNLIPLVHEGISKFNLNFIVGDPKQSIYRFKNGLAEQFVALPEIYNPENDPNLALKSQYFKSLGEKGVIKQNWRSTKTIVEFNNAVFSEWSKNLPDSTISFFEDVQQESVSNEVGYICFQNVEEDKDQSDETVSQMVTWIKEALEDGFKPNDITILGRGNRDCNQWSVELTELGYKVVSADSLFVDSDLYVQWIISYLQKRRSPSVESLTKKFISMTLLVKDLPLSVYEDYFIPVPEKKYKRIDENRFINDFYTSQDDFYLSYESIYDLISKFCTLVKIDSLKNHYVHHLLDMAFQFDLRFGPDLQLFLEQYMAKGKKSSVQLPESEDALTVMTIHKSKGLEFPVVILPKISMTNEKKDKTKYYVPSDGQIVQLSRTQIESLPEFAHQSTEEKEQIVTDNTNLYYVAFTRAKTRLYARNSFKKGSNEDSLGIACLECFPSSWNEETKALILGERLPNVASKNSSKSENEDYIPESLQDFLWFPNIAIENNNPFDEEFTMSEAQQFGNQFHLLLSEIDEASQIDEKLDYLIGLGEIDRGYRDKIKSQTETIFTEFLDDLYKKSDKIMSEQSILFSNEKSSRPDKILFHKDCVIVLDFKTGAEEKKHTKQVKNYAQLLERMGINNVKSALLYTEIPELIWVD
jgi:ATP-dependent exoDNAse (exonuclease V) beta subunit|tara:strand:+ start:5590 stop:8712 length:3123 start_codon:yes stop_codon:yes gene_type:complete